MTRIAQGHSRGRLEPGRGSRWRWSPSYHNKNGYRCSMPLSSILFHDQKPLRKSGPSRWLLQLGKLRQRRLKLGREVWELGPGLRVIQTGAWH